MKNNYDKRIKELEDEVKQLRQMVLDLAMRPANVILAKSFEWTQPTVSPLQPIRYPYITCGNDTQKYQNMQ